LYRKASLAFPFVIVAIAFRYGGLTGAQQCFYRTEPLASLSDPLLLPNLYNVADAYGMRCWLCLANLKTDLTSLTWNDKMKTIHKHLWGGAWNQSSERHEGNSYWGTMREIDPRVKSLDAWEQASREDPLFPLRVQWQPLGKSIGEVIEEMLARVAPPPPATVAQLVQIVNLATMRKQRKAAASK
jgi:hypothetical protein